VFLEGGVRLWPRIADIVGRWAITHMLGLPEHSAGPRVPGTDFLPDYLAFGVLALASVIIAMVWSLVDRRRASYPLAHAWISTVTRFILATLLFWYGWAKLLPAQFGPGMDLALLPRPVGTLTPMNMLWAFMEASRPYAVFSGAAEFAAGLLLLMRRTALLGAILSMAAMANVLMLNVAYDVNVKLAAGAMLAMALSLLAPHAGRLGRLFLLNKAAEPAPPAPLFRDATKDSVARAVGIAVGVVAVYWAFTQAKRTVDELAALPSGPFYGIWRVEETMRDGVIVPPRVTDGSEWRDVVISDGVVVVSMSDAASAYRAMIDASAHTINLRPRPAFPGMTPGVPLQFRFSQPDRDHLEFRRIGGEETLAIRMRHVDMSAYSLINYRHEWRW